MAAARPASSCAVTSAPPSGLLVDGPSAPAHRQVDGHTNTTEGATLKCTWQHGELRALLRFRAATPSR